MMSLDNLPEQVDVLIVGAGNAAMCAAHSAREAGVEELVGKLEGVDPLAALATIWRWCAALPTGLQGAHKPQLPSTRPWSKPSASAMQRPRSWPRGSTPVPRNVRA
jgi:cation diffusion facilitator CzcD-associated flavoprotein CzcO